MVVFDWVCLTSALTPTSTCPQFATSQETPSHVTQYKNLVIFWDSIMYRRVLGANHRCIWTYFTGNIGGVSWLFIAPLRWAKFYAKHFTWIIWLEHQVWHIITPSSLCTWGNWGSQRLKEKVNPSPKRQSWDCKAGEAVFVSDLIFLICDLQLCYAAWVTHGEVIVLWVLTKGHQGV